jgi:hypothetical protein
MIVVFRAPTPRLQTLSQEEQDRGTAAQEFRSCKRAIAILRCRERSINRDALCLRRRMFSL